MLANDTMQVDISAPWEVEASCKIAFLRCYAAQLGVVSLPFFNDDSGVLTLQLTKPPESIEANQQISRVIVNR